MSRYLTVDDLTEYEQTAGPIATSYNYCRCMAELHGCLHVADSELPLSENAVTRHFHDPMASDACSMQTVVLIEAHHRFFASSYYEPLPVTYFVLVYI